MRLVSLLALPEFASPPLLSLSASMSDLLTSFPAAASPSIAWESETKEIEWEKRKLKMMPHLLEA